MKYRVYLATKNIHKVREAQEILRGGNVEILPCPTAVSLPEETGATFEENAVLKAECLSRCLPGELVAGEDSGLVVDSLDGLPGVKSARYAGDDGTDASNIRKLLSALSPWKTPGERRARFVACVCLVRSGRRHIFRGEVEGRITLWPRGGGGFGYDPVFEVPSVGRTFSELSPEEKNACSHRGVALRRMAEYLEAGQDSVFGGKTRAEVK